MSTIRRDSEIVVKFKRGTSMARLARKYKLKLPTIERIVRNWFCDIYECAKRGNCGTM